MSQKLDIEPRHHHHQSGLTKTPPSNHCRYSLPLVGPPVSQIISDSLCPHPGRVPARPAASLRLAAGGRWTPAALRRHRWWWGAGTVTPAQTHAPIAPLVTRHRADRLVAAVVRIHRASISGRAGDTNVAARWTAAVRCVATCSGLPLI